jgi:hypothetical protein
LVGSGDGGNSSPTTNAIIALSVGETPRVRSAGFAETYLRPVLRSDGWRDIVLR